MDDIPEQASRTPSSTALVLAAGMGTRMRSGLHKILHRVAGDPMVFHLLGAIRQAGIEDIVLVVGHRSEQVRAAVGGSVRFVLQEPQLGTGHAVQMGLQLLNPLPERLLVLCGDTPMLSSSTIAKLEAELGDAAAILVTAHLADPRGYGRIVRDNDGCVKAIVEEADATPEQRQLTEINSGLYCFDGRWLARNVDTLQKSAKGEYYLTDMVGIAVAQGRQVRALLVDDASEVLGVNDRIQLAEADRIVRQRICLELMANGVTIVDPATTYIGKDVSVGVDTVIQPGTHLRGKTKIGERCEIGPNSILDNAQVGNDCTVLASVLEDSRVEDRVSIGPFSHLRPGAVVASGARIGNYAEVKNSFLGEGVQMHHFSYMGDAEVGEGTNIGAGTITCNFDGVKKHRTRIGKRVFLGSDTMLRAPIELGDGARTGAGSVVTKDVPAGKLAIGVPARIRNAKGQEEKNVDVDGREGGESGG